MEGWHGRRHETIGSNGSSSSGTIVSGRLSTTSIGSRFSSLSIEAAAMHFDSLEIDEELDGIDEEEEHDGKKLDDWEAEEEETGEERIRSLVQEFFSAQSPNCSSIKRGDMSVLERWVTLSLEDGASSGKKELDLDAWSWIRALDLTTQTICFTRPLLPDGTNLPISTCEEQGGRHVGVRCIRVRDRCHLALVILETMLKILTFVDIVVAWDPNTTEEPVSMDRVMPPYNKLISLQDVLGALSEASYLILSQIRGSTSVEVIRIEDEMTILLSAYKNKLVEAIRSTMEMMKTKLMEDGDDPSSPQESSDIHKVTRSVMTCIRLLCSKYSSVDQAMRDEYYDMIIEMSSCLEEKLANISELFPDQALKFLFLLNNSHFIDLNDEISYFFGLTNKVEGYMLRYLQVSWAPLLSCLFNTTPLCLGKINQSPLSKFESEFQKTYTTQKHWKVPDPKLRRRLRQAITDRIIPVYTRHLEDNKVTNPKISPPELEEMLQELFEG